MLAVLLACLVASSTAKLEAFRGLPGCDYCSGRQKPLEGPFRQAPICCPSRNDGCGYPCFQSLCYCDMFCDRPDGGDCCPDFYGTCTDQPPVTPPPSKDGVFSSIFFFRAFVTIPVDLMMYDPSYVI